MGWGNMGDAAIQEAFIANIKKRLPNAHLVAFSLFPEDTTVRHGLDCHPIQWCYPGWTDSHASEDSGSPSHAKLKSFLKNQRGLYAVAKPIHDCLRELAHLIRSYNTVRSLDLLVIAGGGQLCELHKDIPFNVFKFCLLARLAGKPVYIVGVGADLLSRPQNKFFARWAVRLARYVSFRSVESQALVRSLGVKRRTHIWPDPAYGLQWQAYLNSSTSDNLTRSQAETLFSKLGIDIEAHLPNSIHAPNGSECRSAEFSNTAIRKVGLNPISYCDPRRWPRKDAAIYDRYLRELTAFCARLLQQNYYLELFTSDIMDVHAIADLRTRLLKESSSAVASRVSVRLALTLKDLLLQMCSFDYVVTSKFHGVIFSHMLGKPVIAISYLPKINHLMRAVGHDRYCIGAEHFDANWLIQRFCSLTYEGDLLRSLFLKTSATYERMLQGEFDKLFLPEGTTPL
jgi:polysaccharide pyruvyl transferase WcaK-like protein